MKDSSHDADLARVFESVLSVLNSNVSLLVTIGSVKRVDLLDLDSVEVGAGLTDSWLGGALVNEEDEGVLVFDGLDGALRAQWVLHDGVHIVCGQLWGSSADSLWAACDGGSLWESERDFVPDFSFFLGMSAFLHGFGSLSSLNCASDRLTMQLIL